MKRKNKIAIILNILIIILEIVGLVISTKSGGRLLVNTHVFDLYPNIEENQKSVAYSLTFSDPTRTLTDDEVMEEFQKIVDKVVSTHHAELRNK